MFSHLKGLISLWDPGGSGGEETSTTSAFSEHGTKQIKPIIRTVQKLSNLGRPPPL